MSYVRTAEHRELRRQLIHRWRPWEASTGPRTSEGKRRSARRGRKGAQRSLAREVSKVLEGQIDALALNSHAPVNPHTRLTPSLDPASMSTSAQNDWPQLAITAKAKEQ